MSVNSTQRLKFTSDAWWGRNGGMVGKFFPLLGLAVGRRWLLLSEHPIDVFGHNGAVRELPILPVVGVFVVNVCSSVNPREHYGFLPSGSRCIQPLRSL